MNFTQTESIIKNIIREISQECVNKGHTVSETLVAFMVKAVVLNPKHGFNVDRNLTKEDINTLIKLCVINLLNPKSPSLDTIKMQVYFDMNYTTREQFLEEHRRVLESRMQPVIREITDSRAQIKEEFENLYHKIVLTILLRSGLGSPSDLSVVREATAAVQSVFPQAELGTFLALAKGDKERQLMELTMISTGIRLFNKEYCKGGKGIDDLPAILTKAIPQTSKTIERDIHNTSEYINKYTSILHHILTLEQKQDKITPGLLNLMKQSLINVRQLESFLHIILLDVKNSASQVETYVKELNSYLETINFTVENKTAVPTAQVYPQFIHLAQLWNYLQEEMVLLSVYSNVATSLGSFSKVHTNIFTDSVMNPLLKGIEITNDLARMSSCSEKVVVAVVKEYTSVEWLFPDNTTNFDKLVLECRGFCPVTLCKYEGLLLRGNRDIGIAKYQNYYYAFASKEDAYAFAEEADKYVTSISEIARVNPELIQLLELYNQFTSITPQRKDSRRYIHKAIVKCESETQTDTHFIEKNIVKSYEWNEWELRRKAVKLTDLRHKLTHSTQTDASSHRKIVTTQTYLPKDQQTQTKLDGSSCVPRPQVFLAGLRGSGMKKPTVLTKVDLTLDVQQK
ncbi:cilia- and flagella-associated protein 206-like isoform X1 [Octopus sinensis]|uniref:Cilia- and flagella-associated protein 206 n=2 Tax=Octopus sinensis TaxID=2607531 RepID=A0A6P7U174_9MOLL|nr:cilia- and flagella-associated protein 206-like isoform X1 [Octopus sinensis]XP_036355081.1 cilia- and flagella-associated protein 206-like isoform X1 [Octopus sinensis]